MAAMLKRAGVALLLVILWAAGLVMGTVYGWWRRPLAPSDDPRAFMRAAIPIVSAGNRANTAVILIESGAIAAEHYSANAESIDRNTVFATASLSKWITAHAVMKLVEQGKLDLDRPVESYLTRWHLPAGAFSSRGVTARRLLSHTAGLGDALGFGDYRSDEALPTLEDALTAPRASTGRSAASISVAIEPGTQFRYSGGGYLLLELLVEERSGEQFETFVKRELLESMRTAEATSMGVDIWGLGTVLYAPTEHGGVVFGHDGTNEPAISATVRINPETQDAIIVLATGSKVLASQLGAEWVFWQTGLPDILTIPAEIRRVMPVFGAGACAILLFTFVPVWRKRRGRTQGAAAGDPVQHQASS